MTWWHCLLRRDRMERQLDKEMRFHLDQHTADRIARVAIPRRLGGRPGCPRRRGASEGVSPRCARHTSRVDPMRALRQE